ncbi:hypothetical protein LguiA_011053 [Lonicera macranthoides]
MATLNKSFTTILELLTITILFAAPSISVEAPTEAYEAPSPDEQYAQNLPKSFKEFVTECAKKMATHCSEEVVISLFNATKVSDHCCQKLVEMGYDCHIALVKIFVGLPEAKGYKSTILENGDKVYNECELVVKNKPIAPSPSPSV